MYISQLVINGFKTFNSKTALEFGDGITAIVGPNGCGKTNIVDAIRWVLGEQKYRTLRSARMEDVIFNGAKGTKPTSMCEVYLTVKNDKGKLPIEYTDVEIGRRLYRDGESDYSINRTSCRLKDVNNLFIDTGMGADSYSVIELKMIEQILSETDDDRKFLFEEAAGINKYKTQRRLSIKKFEATKFDLERINDIISEVETKVKGLNLQLKRFKRHSTLVEKLKSYEIDLGTLQINKYIEISDPLRKKINEFSHLRSSQVSDQDLNEAELNKLRKIYNDQEIEIKEIRSNIENLDVNREETRQRILVWQEQNNSAESNIVRLNNETESNKQRIEKYNLNIKDISQEIDFVIPQIDEKLADFKIEQEKYNNIESEYKNDQKIVDDIQSERWELQKTMSDDKSLMISAESSITERNTQVERINQNISDETELIEKLIAEEKTLNKKQNSAESKTKDLIERKDKIVNKIEIHSQELNEIKNEQQSHYARLESLKNQLQFYEELVISQSDSPRGLKYALDKNVESESIIGTVANIFSTDEKYESAINSALGEFAHCLVCKNRKSAIEVLRNIRKDEAGKISIIPFDEVQNKDIKLPSIPINDLIIGRGSDLVKSEIQFKPLVDLLLGKTLIVSNIEDAIQSIKQSGWTLIDLDGTSYINNLILSNPSSVKGTTIGRKQKIDQLKLSIEDLEDITAAIDNKISKYNSKRTDAVKQLDIINAEIKLETVNFEKLRSDYQRIKFEIDNKQNVISNSKKEIFEIKRSITELQNSLERLTEKVTKSEKNISGIKGRLDDANEKLQESQRKRDEHHQKMQDLRIALLNLENSRDNKKLQKKTAENTIIEIEERQNKITIEIKEINDNSKQRTQQVNTKEKELIEINAKLKKSRSVLELKEQTYRDTYHSIEEIEDRIKSEQKSRESILEELKQCEVAIAEYKQKISSIKERINDRYNESIPHGNPIDKTEDELNEEIEKLERSIENIGPVNMAVQVEYEEEQKRLDHLITQRDDLIKSEENLRDSIDKIDRIARKQFRETFDHIKANFENLFTIFFEGGQGTLELIGDPDPLEAEIAIRAQPPGKRNQTLRMLSAGEKSLTAIALLFAIYQYKPSPYCILDEVDAPLDDTNVLKFTRALKSFTKDTQFIVVTHNKLTMESADYLYGVTMEKKGVSKLVSVKFD